MSSCLYEVYFIVLRYALKHFERVATCLAFMNHNFSIYVFLLNTSFLVLFLLSFSIALVLLSATVSPFGIAYLYS